MCPGSMGNFRVLDFRPQKLEHEPFGDGYFQPTIAVNFSPSLATLRVRSPDHPRQMMAKIVKKQISDAEQHCRARQRAMNIPEFCERYGPGRTKAYEELKSGRLRARKIGKRTVITDDDAEEWLRHLPVIEGGK
jgi:predicted DNA-binding transcriptional regulator AlpA